MWVAEGRVVGDPIEVMVLWESPRIVEFILSFWYTPVARREARLWWCVPHTGVMRIDGAAGRPW